MAEKTKAQEKLNIVDSSSPFGVVEAYKTLRANLQFVCPHSGCKIICVTSSVAHEGKSSTSVNLALDIAASDQRVLYIDGDMRASHIAEDLGLRKGPGLANLLASGDIDEDYFRSFVQHIEGKDGLDMIVAGKRPPNPSELLNSERMTKLLEEAKSHYDYIIIDGAPIGIVSDVLVLAPHIDGYVVVVKADMTTKFMIRDTLKAIERIGGKTLGVVLNGVRTKGSGYGRYGKYCKYGKYGKYGRYGKYGDYS